MVRLRARLARSGALGATLLNLLSRGDLTESDWVEIEETLLLADVGAGPTDELMDALRTKVKVLGTSEPGQVRAMVREELLDRKSTRLNSSHVAISYAVFCLK